MNQEDIIIIDNIPYLVIDMTDEWNPIVLQYSKAIRVHKWTDGKYRFEYEGYTQHWIK